MTLLFPIPFFLHPALATSCHMVIVRPPSPPMPFPTFVVNLRSFKPLLTSFVPLLQPYRFFAVFVFAFLAFLYLDACLVISRLFSSCHASSMFENQPLIQRFFLVLSSQIFVSFVGCYPLFLVPRRTFHLRASPAVFCPVAALILFPSPIPTILLRKVFSPFYGPPPMPQRPILFF